MNIIEMEDMVKGLPDQVLFQEAQAPSGRFPQYLAVSEIQRRNDMRQRFSARAPQEGTVKDQILNQGLGALQGMMPESAPPMAPGMAPPMAPQMAPEMGQTPPNMGPPVQMSGGGIVRMQGGGISSLNPRYLPSEYTTAELLSDIFEMAKRSSIPGPGGSSRSSQGAPSNSQAAAPSGSGSRAPTILPGTYNPPSALIGDQIAFDKAAPDRAAPAEAPKAAAIGIPSAGLGLADNLMSREEYLDMVGFDQKAFDDAFAPVDYGDIIGRLEETSKRYSSEADASINQMREQAKKEALGYALMQMGAGLAGGDMARGLERGAEAAFGVLEKSKQRETDERRAARAEARALEAQGLQLEVSGRGLSAQAKRDRFNSMRQSQIDMANAFRQFGIDEMEARYKAANLAQQAAATAATMQREGRLDKRAAVDLFQSVLSNAMKDPPMEAKMNPKAMDAYRQMIYAEAAKITQKTFPEFDFKDLTEATNQPTSNFLSPELRSRLESLRGK